MIKKIFNISKLEKELEQYSSLTNSFEYLSITLASPNEIQAWCEKILPTGQIVGQVFNSETVNDETKRPINGGLFCEKIFGPIISWKCRCGKYQGVMPSKVCEICGVQLTETRIRRYKMGYIPLPAPVSHFWYFKNSPAYLLLILNLMDPSLQIETLEKIIYYYRENKNNDKYLSRDKQLKILKKKMKKDKDFDDSFPYEQVLRKSKTMLDLAYNTGSEFLLNLLTIFSNSLEEKIDFLREKVSKKDSTSFENNSFEMLRIMESFFATNTKFEWMMLTNLPILPPGLRPFVQVEDSQVIAADLNDFYIEIFERIARYKNFIKKYELNNDALAYHEKRLIQYGVDGVIDNAKLPPQHIFTTNNRTLKSLTEILEGKFGRFRQTLLGKRVDYSGRSVIVVEPDLQLNEFGLPYNIAIELFRPYLINMISKSKIKNRTPNAKEGSLILNEKPIYIWKLLEKLLENFSLLLNRAPTLHRFGIQAFSPILTPTKAILLHPLVCTGFNADFDGDQMAIHLPLYEASQLEAKSMMRPSFNIFSPANGEAIVKPTQDMVIGCYYLTLFLIASKTFNNFCFSNEDEALSLFYQKKLSIHTQIFIRYSLDNLIIKIKKKELFLCFFKVFPQKVKILKSLKLTSSKILIFTNIGIFLAKKKSRFKYKVSNLFLSTTPGRILLNTIFKNLT